ncbi:MAG: carotenoid oxygenase family protein [Cyanobacteria bacterium]|nr:carotenoid oxygenase family protein [Cyanobacteriota bacterium]MDA0867298.1 carotenoid oxygenase family protein [Cyanobacteriota bacterium]
MGINAVRTETTVQPTWAGAIAAPALEFPLAPLAVMAGAVPAALQGSLYRNGPACLERQGQRVGHWFDGDGAILAVHFAAGQAQATYRYVQSAGYVDESAADQFLYSGYGSLAPGPIWQRWQAQFKNAANTSVLALPDRILALWEGGMPHAMDRHTLATQGIDALDSLTANEPYSAHPKRHPKTGHIFNFGVVAGATATLNCYRSGPDGRIQKKSSLDLNGIPLIHDFVLADRYLVFCVPPVRLNALPAVLGFRSFSDALMWQPRWGTQLVVVDADSFDVMSWGQADPWFQWHFGRGYVDDYGDIVLEVVRYGDFDTNQHLKEVASGTIHTKVQGQLWRVQLNPQTAAIRDQTCLVADSCEFPVVPNTVDLGTAPTYLSMHGSGTETAGELFGAIARFDPQTDRLTVADAGAQRYPSEPVFAPNPDHPGQGWILTVVYDGEHHCSELWIYDSDALGAGPLCRLALPEVIPHSFHGVWQGA